MLRNEQKLSILKAIRPAECEYLGDEDLLAYISGEYRFVQPNAGQGVGADVIWDVVKHLLEAICVIAPIAREWLPHKERGSEKLITEILRARPDLVVVSRGDLEVIIRSCEKIASEHGESDVHS